MAGDPQRLTTAIEEVFNEKLLKDKLSSLQSTIASALDREGKFLYQDEMGNSYQITTTNGASEPREKTKQGS